MGELGDESKGCRGVENQRAGLGTTYDSVVVTWENETMNHQSGPTASGYKGVTGIVS